MAASEDIAAKPKSVVIRMLGVFAFLFGLPYLIQAVGLLTRSSSVRSELILFHLLLAIITLDVVLSMAAIVIGVGLFLHKEWARKTWLVYLVLLLFVHFNMTVIQLLGGFTRMTALYKWIAVVVVVTIISWAFLLKPSIKAHFN
ncbi:MAG TPA: hypothetical protein VFH15_05385 [Pyrinomonadaceae bacterium]|nr:hypothetical protein [Pyrinomonadaceae bacterium]